MSCSSMPCFSSFFSVTRTAAAPMISLLPRPRRLPY
jgi:hypothetical protein